MEKNIIPINIIKSYVFDINKKVGQSQGEIYGIWKMP